MLRTRICGLLNIEHPILQASMAWVSNAEMVAAISNAGCLGTFGPNAGSVAITRDPRETGERLRAQIIRAKKLTERPFAVNIVVPGPGEEVFTEAIINVAVEEAVPVAIVSQGSAKIYTGRLKRSGMKVLHVVGNTIHAKSAESAGVDAVITSGTEGGGHSGFDHLTTFTLVPQIADRVKIPVVAGGGVGDAKGFMAALVLGAEGVYMGTRFIATKECPVHQNWKDALVESESFDTIAISHGRKTAEGVTDVQAEMRFGSVRLLRNEFSQRCLELVTKGKSHKELMDTRLSRPKGYDGEDVSRAMVSAVYGDIKQGAIATGQVVGLIKDIPSCQDLIDRITTGAERILSRIGMKPNL